LAQGAATLHDIEMAVRDEPVPLWRIPRADMNDVAFDLAKHSVAIGTVDCKKAAFTLVRQADGVVNVARLVRTTARTGTNAGAASDDAGWSFVAQGPVRECRRGFRGQGSQPPVGVPRSPMRALRGQADQRGRQGRHDAVAKIGRGGRLRVSGALATNPLRPTGASTSGLDRAASSVFRGADQRRRDDRVAAKGRLFDGCMSGSAPVMPAMLRYPISDRLTAQASGVAALEDVTRPG
jgi:hypothetical protein